MDFYIIRQQILARPALVAVLVALVNAVLLLTLTDRAVWAVAVAVLGSAVATYGRARGEIADRARERLAVRATMNRELARIRERERVASIVG